MSDRQKQPECMLGIDIYSQPEDAYEQLLEEWRRAYLQQPDRPFCDRRGCRATPHDVATYLMRAEAEPVRARTSLREQTAPDCQLPLRGMSVETQIILGSCMVLDGFIRESDLSGEPNTTETSGPKQTTRLRLLPPESPE